MARKAKKSGSLNRHVENIFKALAPDLAAWRIIGTVEGRNHCACGHHIEVAAFVLKRPGDEHEVYIGETCIEETIPYLQKMTIGDKSDAVKNWQEQLLEWRRQQALKAGEERLRAILPTAAAIDLWFAESCRRLQGWLPQYFRDRLWRRFGEIGRDKATHGDRAKVITRNLAGFRDHVTFMFQDAKFRNVKLDELPELPSATDEWLKLRFEAEALREHLKRMPFKSYLDQDEHELVHGVLPATEKGLAKWLSTARLLEANDAAIVGVLHDLRERLAVAVDDDLEEIDDLRSASKRKSDESLSAWLVRARRILEETPDIEGLKALAAKKRRELEEQFRQNRRIAAERRAAAEEAERVRREQEAARRELERREREQRRIQAEAEREREREATKQRDALLRAAEEGQRKLDLEQRIAGVKAFLQTQANDACYRLTFEPARHPKSQAIELQAKSPDSRTIYVLARRDASAVRPGDICLCEQRQILRDTPQLRVVLVGLRANVSANERQIASLQDRLQQSA